MSSITENGNVKVEENREEEEENNNINLSKDREFDGNDDDVVNDEVKTTTIEIVKCDSKPTLVLKEFDSANTETDTDTLAFCPIPVTPKKLVDSNDQNGYDDDDFNDDDYYSDEEDELLYRFLDKSNEIVRFFSIYYFGFTTFNWIDSKRYFSQKWNDFAN